MCRYITHACLQKGGGSCGAPVVGRSGAMAGWTCSQGGRGSGWHLVIGPLVVAVVHTPGKVGAEDTANA